MRTRHKQNAESERNSCPTTLLDLKTLRTRNCLLSAEIFTYTTKCKIIFGSELSPGNKLENTFFIKPALQKAMYIQIFTSKSIKTFLFLNFFPLSYIAEEVR